MLRNPRTWSQLSKLTTTPFLILATLLLVTVGVTACGAPSAAPPAAERSAAVAADVAAVDVEEDAAAEDAAARDAAAEDLDAEEEADDQEAESGSALEAPRGMDTIALAELPPEALETIVLIANDGPFPYSKDGTTFFNRERILPAQPEGYYREYTVETPGSPDRGARRIVGGAEGELYYTDDHYNSFSWIVIE